MKRFGLVGFLLALLVGLFGCGGSAGDGGTGGHAGPMTGIWSGSITRSTDQIEVAWTLDGGNLTGAARLTRDGTVYVGHIAGTVDGNSFDVTGNYDGLTGVFHYTGTFTTTQIQATIARDGVPEGSMTLQRTGDNTAASISGHYVGTWTNTTMGGSGTLTVDLTQDGNSATGTYNDGITQGTFSAALIGNHFTAGFAASGSSGRVSWSGTIVGTTIAGPYTGTNSHGSYSGTFSITRM